MATDRSEFRSYTPSRHGVDGFAAAAVDQASPAFVIDLTDGHGAASAPIRPLAEAPVWQLFIKRFIDMVGAMLALIALSPVMLLTALAVMLTSRGPVLFAQERVGYKGATFRLLKFRSMYVDAEERRSELGHLNCHEHGPIFKIPDDPRMTPVGKVIRRFSLDELPQLFHVLEGTMSLVGPRPPLPEEVATYNSRAMERLDAKPGITCIWQVSGRSELDFDTWVEMDVAYIHGWSLGLDLKLLLRTIPAVVSGRGAY